MSIYPFFGGGGECYLPLLPLGMGNVTSDFECSDLITPNRLHLGRNNNQKPAGEMITCEQPTNILKFVA